MSLVASTQSSSVMASMVTLPLSLSFTSRRRTADAGRPVASWAVAAASARFAASSLGSMMVTVPLPRFTRKLGRAGAACEGGEDGGDGEESARDLVTTSQSSIRERGRTGRRDGH